MRPLSRTILLLVLWLNASIVPLAQKVGPGANVTPPEEGKIVTEYDASGHAVLVKFERVFLLSDKVEGPMKNWLNMMGAVYFRGKEPTDVVLGFTSKSEKGCKYLNRNGLKIVFVADREEFKTDSTYTFSEPALDGSCTESISAVLSRETFHKISRAGKVTLELGETKLELDGKHLSVFRNFVSHLDKE
jgi:hypothetical protein